MAQSVLNNMLWLVFVPLESHLTIKYFSENWWACLVCYRKWQCSLFMQIRIIPFFRLFYQSSKGSWRNLGCWGPSSRCAIWTTLGHQEWSRCGSWRWNENHCQGLTSAPKKGVITILGDTQDKCQCSSRLGADVLVHESTYGRQMKLPRAIRSTNMQAALSLKMLQQPSFSNHVSARFLGRDIGKMADAKTIFKHSNRSPDLEEVGKYNG